jgi:uncharacterized membrane protein YqjE
MATSVDRTTTDGDTKSLRELVSEMTGEISQLFRAEIELAKTEAKEEAAKAARAGAMFGVAGFVAYLAVIMLSFAAAWALAAVIPDGLAFLLVGVAYVVVAAVCFLMGRKRIQEFSPVPQETVETLKEDVEWARARKS